MSTINTISTLQKSISSRTAIADQDARVEQARKELVTGLKADVYADRSFRGAQTLDLRNRIGRMESYATSNRLLEGKLEVTSELLRSVRTQAQEFQSLSLALSGGTQRRDTLQVEAQALLNSLSAELNTVYSGEYLFSGSNGLAEPISLSAQGLGPMGLPANADLATTQAHIAAIDGYFALNGLQTQPGFDDEVYKGSNEAASARLDENISFDYGVQGNDQAIRQLLKGLSMYAQIDLTEMRDDQAYQAWVNEANMALNEGIIGLQSHEVTLGNQQSLLARTVERQDTLAAVYNNRVVDIEGVDEYEVATRLETLSAQLEASYAVTVRLKNLSLLNYL